MFSAQTTRRYFTFFRSSFFFYKRKEIPKAPFPRGCLKGQSRKRVAVCVIILSTITRYDSVDRVREPTAFRVAYARTRRAVRNCSQMPVALQWCQQCSHPPERQQWCQQPSLMRAAVGEGGTIADRPPLLLLFARHVRAIAVQGKS